jgi:uncharacterized damage-inducible protein DinB
MKDVITTLYDYGRWANERLLAAAGALSGDQLRRKLTKGADPILETFGHIVGADLRWLARWQGETPPTVTKTEFADLGEIRARWEKLYPVRRAYITALDDASLRESIIWMRGDTPVKVVRWQAMVHCANHGTQHRSEIAAMLTDLGHSPGDLDLMLYCGETPAR